MSLIQSFCKEKIDTLVKEVSAEAKFTLLSEVKKEADSEAAINKLINENKLLVARRVCGGRNDGLTERIRSIIVSYVYYKYFLHLKYNLTYEFIWPLNAEKYEFTSITSEIPAFIKADFVKNFFTPKFSKNRLNYGSLPEKGLREPENIIDFFDLAIVDYYTIETPRVIRNPELLRLVPLALHDIFSEETHVKFELIQQKLPQKLLGLHLRGGDVVYGRFKDDIRLGKSLPLPLAEKFISNNPGSSVVIFGTNTGQSLNDLEYLKNKYSNVLLSFDFYDEKEYEVLFDSYIASNCELVYSAGNSAVTSLAALFNGKLDCQENGKNESDILCLKEYLDMLGSKYNSQQRIYSAKYALKLCHKNKLTNKYKEFFNRLINEC